MPTLPIRPTPSPKTGTAAWVNLLVKRIKAVEQQPSQPTTRHNALVNAGPSHAAVSMPRRHEALLAPHGHNHRATHNVHASLRIIQRNQQQPASTAPQPGAQHTGTQYLEANLIAMDDEKLVFADTSTKCGGCDIPKEETDQKRFGASRWPTSPSPRWRTLPASVTTS